MYNYKGKNKRPIVPQVIIDDFFETPDTIREWALRQEFFKGENRGTWPGIRTHLLDDISKELYNTMRYKLLKEYPQFKDFSDIDASFQVITEEWDNGWVHEDNDVHRLAGVVFLTPNPPQGAGNTVYMEQDDVSADKFQQIFDNDMTLEADHRDTKKYRNEQRSLFTPSVRIENRYNRCVAFDPRMWHSADQFFGTTKENGRLTLVFFCNE